MPDQPLTQEQIGRVKRMLPALRNEAEKWDNDDCPSMAESTSAAAKALAAMLACVERLPRYVDTGAPFVPGVDPAWMVDNENDEVWELNMCDEFVYLGHSNKWGDSAGMTETFYSTRAAAEAAAKGDAP